MLSTTLFKLTLIVSILGTFTILLISEFSELPLQDINQLTEAQLETKVKIQGRLLSLKETPGLYLLKVTDNTATISIIIFKEDPLDLKTNQHYEIEGTLTEYNNELEILAELITKKRI